MCNGNCCDDGRSGECAAMATPIQFEWSVLIPAGSASDTVTRVVLDRVAQLLGQPMVIEVRPGAGGSLGFASVARSDPDGYTLVTSSSSMATERVLHKTSAVRSRPRFHSGGLDRYVAEHPGCLETERVQDRGRSRRRRQGEAGDARPLRQRASARPRTWPPSDSVSPPRSTSAMCRSAKAAWRSDGRAHRLLFHSAGGRRRGAESDKLTILAVSAPNACRGLPNVPSVVEAGYPGAVFRFWNGISAPAKTPQRRSCKSCTTSPKRAQAFPRSRKNSPNSESNQRRSASKSLANSSRRPRRDGKARQGCRY